MFEQYNQILERLYQLFSSCPNPYKQEYAGGWTVKEVVGHLIDSASNNHQRVQRYVPGGNLEFPGYDQELCVQRGHYASFDFRRLVELWYQHNQLLLHMFNHLPTQDVQTATITVGDRPPCTLAELVHDYFAHMELHEQHVQRILRTAPLTQTGGTTNA
jgi:hypothetical protein